MLEGFAARVQLLHLFALLAYAALAVYVLTRRSRTALHWACAALLLCFAFWCGSLLVAHDPHASRATARLAYHVGAIAWCSFGSMLVCFAAVLLRARRLLRSRLFVVVLVVPVALSLFAQWSGYLASDYPRRAWGWGFSWGDGFWPLLFNAYYGLYVAGGLIAVLLVTRRADDPLRRRQGALTFYTAAVPLLLASVTDVLLPRLGVTAMPNIGPDLVLVWAAGLVYGIARYSLLELTPAVATEQIVSTMSEALLLLDTQERIVFANEAACALLERDQLELGGQRLSNLAPEPWRERLEPLAGAVDEHGRLELPLVRASGQVHVLLSTSAVRGPADEKAGTVCLATNISDQMHAAEALRQARDELERSVAAHDKALGAATEEITRLTAEQRRCAARYRALVSAMQEGLWRVDDKLRTVSVTPRLATLLGRSEEQLSGRPVQEISDPLAVLLRSSANEAELVLREPDGEPHRVQVRVARLEKEAGEPESLVTVLETER